MDNIFANKYFNYDPYYIKTSNNNIHYNKKHKKKPIGYIYSDDHVYDDDNDYYNDDSRDFMANYLNNIGTNKLTDTTLKEALKNLELHKKDKKDEKKIDKKPKKSYSEKVKNIQKKFDIPMKEDKLFSKEDKDDPRKQSINSDDFLVGNLDDDISQPEEMKRTYYVLDNKLELIEVVKGYNDQVRDKVAEQYNDIIIMNEKEYSQMRKVDNIGPVTLIDKQRLEMLQSDNNPISRKYTIWFIIKDNDISNDDISTKYINSGFQLCFYEDNKLFYDTKEKRMITDKKMDMKSVNCIEDKKGIVLDKEFADMKSYEIFEKIYGHKCTDEERKYISPFIIKIYIKPKKGVRSDWI